MRSTSLRFFLELAVLGAVLLGQPAMAQSAPPAAAPGGAPLWLRQPALSPDGRQLAFTYQGSLWLVPREGGEARVLVANGGHVSKPLWSPDGRHIAYASDLHGNADLFIVPAQGGASRRLTTHSAPETPIAFTPDGQAVLFAAQRMDAPSGLAFPARPVTQLYQVSVAGGRRPVQLFSAPVRSGRLDAAGRRLVYEDWKGYEDEFRKHHVSPVARDIWLWDAGTRQHRQLSTWGGEDREPLWSPDERHIVYLSERSGSFNVWRMPLDRPEAAEQVTHFQRHPVRGLSSARDGTLAFSFDGELYTLAPGERQAVKVSVRIGADTLAPRLERQTLQRGATELAVSPDGQEVAFVIRGEVFVASTEFGQTRRITSTPWQERSVSFSPDGRKLLFAGEEGGAWNLYEASLPGDKKSTPNFFNAPQVQVKPLLKNGQENFQPRYSPDGKEVAYLENRTTLKVLNLASGQARTVLPGEWNYSYEDGDQWFDWSPDGRWLLATTLARQRWSAEVSLVDARGGQPPLNLTRSGYEDTLPRWAQGGRMMIWLSDREGLGGPAADAQTDVFGMFFTREAHDRFRLDRAEAAQLKKREEEDKKAADKAAEEAAKAKGGSAAAAPPQGAASAPVVKLELTGMEERVVRLTSNSGNVRDMVLTPDGEVLYTLVQTADNYELWVHRLRAKEVRRVGNWPAVPAQRFRPEPAELLLDAKAETAFVLTDGSLRKFKLPKDGEGDVKLEPLRFDAELRLDRLAEREHMFEHVWRQTLKKLYAADMKGLDWAGYKRDYQRFLPHLGDNHDFAEVLSEMLGELDVSHTGAGYRPPAAGQDATAALGLFFDEAHTGAGLKVAEVIEGGPLDRAGSAVKPGVVIERIDGQAIAAGAEFDSLLEGRAGKRIELGLLDPASGQRHTQVARPISLAEQGELLYLRWVKRQREAVERLSGGQLGYVHVRGMNEASFRSVYSQVLGRYTDKRGLVVDTRFNGGGNLHDELTTFLSGKPYLENAPRGQSLGWAPYSRWQRPSVVLMSESNYSDAHLFPWLYRFQKIGSLVGMPVAGTGTAVWWERLQDPTLVFGIPQVGFRDAQGRWMEVERVDPDVRAPIDPARLQAGQDQQLEAAVQTLLKQLSQP